MLPATPLLNWATSLANSENLGKRAELVPSLGAAKTEGKRATHRRRSYREYPSFQTVSHIGRNGIYRCTRASHINGANRSTAKGLT